MPALPNMPSLAVQPKVFLETQLVFIREGLREIPEMSGNYLLQTMQRFKYNQATGRDTLMAAALYGIPDPDLEAIAQFLAHLAP